jgi:hypothetical protein
VSNLSRGYAQKAFDVTIIARLGSPSAYLGIRKMDYGTDHCVSSMACLSADPRTIPTQALNKSTTIEVASGNSVLKGTEGEVTSVLISIRINPQKQAHSTVSSDAHKSKKKNMHSLDEEENSIHFYSLQL